MKLLRNLKKVLRNLKNAMEFMKLLLNLKNCYGIKKKGCEI